MTTLLAELESMTAGLEEQSRKQKAESRNRIALARQLVAAGKKLLATAASVLTESEALKRFNASTVPVQWTDTAYTVPVRPGTFPQRRD